MTLTVLRVSQPQLCGKVADQQISKLSVTKSKSASKFTAHVTDLRSESGELVNKNSTLRYKIQATNNKLERTVKA